ncbi:histone H3-like centromeric protein A isoform X2 [Passer domesticus]|uniref:histone H3-like centromeric protein A isoform X2 n=1 Tax=Passer domesticus TaxID=48849 RepID=UPI0030FED631
MPRPKPSPRRRGGTPAPSPPRPRARRRRPGQLALQEIRKYQSSTRLLLRPGSFARLVRELCLLFTRGVDYRWQSMALLALQEFPTGTPPPTRPCTEPVTANNPATGGREPVPPEGTFS